MSPHDPKVVIYEYNIDHMKMMIEYNKLISSLNFNHIQSYIDKFNEIKNSIKHLKEFKKIHNILQSYREK